MLRGRIHTNETMMGMRRETEREKKENIHTSAAREIMQQEEDGIKKQARTNRQGTENRK